MNTKPIFEFDKQFGPVKLAGVDEAGRGPLAGPVVCACCMLPLDEPIEGVNDSKQLTERARERLYTQITQRAIAYAIAVIDHRVIDNINILNATKLGMKQAIEDMKILPDLVLIDAVTKLDVSVPYRSIIKGDAKSYSVAAASILAKVTRDRIMREYDGQYPDYGFAQNKGYGTERHIAALRQKGECPIHRQTFLRNFKQGAGREHEA